MPFFDDFVTPCVTSRSKELIPCCSQQSKSDHPPGGPHNNKKQAPSQPALHNSEPKKDPILELKIPAPPASKYISQNPRIPAGILET
jgi:hypothetical protein